MTSDDWLKIVQPLTHPRTGGGCYERQAAVEAEIRSVLILPSLALIQRAKLRDRHAGIFLREETLAYFIRAYHRAGEQEVVIALTNALLARCASWVTRRLRALGLRRHYLEDAYFDVVRAVVGAITDLESDRGDFYQVRFARALKLKVLTAYDVQLREMERLKEQVPFGPAAESMAEESDDESGGGKFLPEMAEPSRADDELLDAEERAERQGQLESVLKAIRDQRHREAFVLHVIEGWQITNEDPLGFSLVRRFKKSPKTIYNWVKQAEADIAAAGFAAWREEE